MMNVLGLRFDPYAGFRFVVLIDHLLVAGFSKVRGLQRETKVETYHEGGVNDFEHKLVTSTSYPNLVLERGLFDPQLWNWHQDVIEGRVRRRTMVIALLQGLSLPAWSWTVQDAYPVKWTCGDFDASSGQVTAETLELVHNGMLLRTAIPRLA